jgi:hypothetical protein
MFTKIFLVQLAERAVKTFAQTLVALAGASQMDWLNLDWQHLAATSLIAAGLSVLTSIASDKVGPTDSPSMVKLSPAVMPPEGIKIH